MRVKINRDNVFVIINIILYVSIFYFVCLYYVTPIYSYANFAFIYDAQKHFYFFLSALAMSLLIIIQNGCARRFYMTTLYVMSIVPFMCLYFCSPSYTTYTVFFVKGITTYIVVALVTAICARCRFIQTHRNIYFFALKTNTIIAIFSVFTIFTIARYIILNGLDIFNLNILRVYETRLLLRGTMGGLFAYIDNWSMIIFNPFCIILSIHLKKYKFAIFFIVIQIILFGFNSQKITLFIVVILLVFYFCARLLLRKTSSIIFCAILGSLVVILSNSRIMLSIWRRALLVPTQLNYYYGEYFSCHEFDWFARSFLRHFVTSSYDMPLPRVIGAEYFNNPAMNANTGFLGAGYAQGGMIVMVIYAIFLGIIINIIDTYTKVISPKIVIGVTLMPMLTVFISSDLPTSFITGGIFVTLLLLSILSRCQDRGKLI